jgi:peptide/nickel transport system permease protein
VRRFIAARFLQGAIVVVIVTMIAFLLLRLAPGDPFSYENPSISPAIRAQWRAAFGFDKPVAEQFVRYFANAAQGKFGYSVIARRPVAAVIADALPRSLILAAVSLTFAIIIGVAIGVLGATRPRSFRDRALTVFSVFVYSIPDFWLALLFQMTLGFGLRLFPISDMADPLTADYGSMGEVFVDRVYHMALPALSLTVLIAVVLARYQRAALLDVLPSDFLRTARAKGATERDVVIRHALRNALIPTITMLGVIVPTVLGGIFFIEYVFNWPGIGLLAVTSVQALDYDVATACVIIAGVLVAASSFVADVLTALVDPRIRDA